MSKFTTGFLLILSFFFCQMASIALAADSAVSFSNNRSIHLRDENLRNPRVIQKEADISIDPEFLKRHLGTESPTLEQIEQLLLNPTEVSKNIVTLNAVEVGSRRVFSDYFFPVVIKNKNGEISKGKMALQAYHRTGIMDLKMPEGAPAQASKTKTQIETLREQNRPATEAGTVEACADCKAASALQQTVQMAGAIEQAAKSSNNLLFQKYQDFAREFTTKQGPITRRNAGAKKRLFVKLLVEKLGAADAASILAALTGFGEAPHRKNSSGQIVEIAAILKVIENRARAEFRSDSRTLRDIGLSNKLNSVMTSVLADSQFSVWNDYDNNLSRTLNFNPDKADPLSSRKMSLAFEAQRMMDNKQIEFLGKMNAGNLYHYHANYVAPDWASRKKRVEAPAARIKRMDAAGREESVDVILQKSGVRHLFYAGIS